MFLCQLCPRWRGSSPLGQRLHLRWHLRARCGLCRRHFAHGHLGLLHRRLGRCRGTLRARNAALRARLLREGVEEHSESLSEVVETEDGGSASVKAKHVNNPSKESQAHVCPKCGMVMKHAKTLRKHLDCSESCGSNVPAKDQLCQKCGRKGSFVWLRNHLATSRSCGTHAQRYKCDTCGVAKPHLSDVASHVRSFKSCRIYQRRMSNEAALRKGKGRGPDGRFACHKCGRSQGTPVGLKSHLYSSRSCGSNAQSYRCDDCGRAFPMRGELLSHKLSSTACRQEFRRQRVFAEAGLDTGRIAAADFQCPKCAKLFKWPHALDLHMKSPVACAFRLRRKELAEYHKRRRGAFECLKCGVRLKTSSSLRHHLTLTRQCGDQAGRFPCPKCARTFAFPSTLASHQARRFCDETLRLRKRWSFAKPSDTCAKCGKSFPNRDQLRGHLTQSRSCGDQVGKLKCDGCQFTCALPSTLRRHKGGGCARARKQALHKALAGEPLVKGFYRCRDCDFKAHEPGKMSQHRQNANGCRLRRLRERNRRLVAAVEIGKTNVADILQETNLFPPASAQPIPVCTVEERTCPKCQRTMGSVRSLKGHLRNTQSCGEKPVKRRLAAAKEKALPEVTPNEKHVDGANAITARANRTCPKCGSILGSAATLREHVRKSQSCGYEPRKKAAATRSADKTYPCPKCGTKLLDARGLKGHLRSSRTCGSLAASCSCDRCGMAFCKPSVIGKHIFSRIACDRELKRRQTLERVGVRDESKSLQNLGKEKRHWSCGRCGVKFAQIFRLRQHVDQVGSCGDGGGTVACDDCGHATAMPCLAKHFDAARKTCRGSN